VFATFEPLARHGADGLKVDADGRVYVTGGGGLFVWSADGFPLGILTLPENPANVAWGDAGYNVLYLTARTSVYRVPMKVQGIAPGPR
jgi:sugar lactone lactonase YvrE